MSWTHPPPFSPTPIVSKAFRFQCATAGSYNILWKDLGDLLFVATSATTGSQLAYTVRLRKVEVWAPMASDLVPVTTSLEWYLRNPGTQGNSRIVSDTSMGANSPAHIVCRPPRTTLEGYWQDSTSTDVAFKLVVPLNAVIDVHFAFTLREDGSASSVTTAPSGATTGATYCRALNSTTSLTTLPPVSYSSK